MAGEEHSEAQEAQVAVAPVADAAVTAPDTPEALADAARDDAEYEAEERRIAGAQTKRLELTAGQGLALVGGLATLVLFVLPPLWRSGIWDPYELNVADLSRRMAVTLHGASKLALEDADNSMPHLNDLGRPQLAFSSIALGFKFFGLYDWAGRLPLAVWGLVALLATYGFISRLTDRRTGVFAAASLVSMPLFSVQARTMLGDIVPMAGFAMALGGMLVALLDDDVRIRIGWALVAILGLVVGFFSRGGILGIAAPCLSVGLTWILLVANGRRRDNLLSHLVGALALGAGGFAAYRGYRALEVLEYRSDLSHWVGALIRPPAKYPTFDQTLAHLGHAIAPWSAFVPVALGRMFLAPPVSENQERESGTRAALLISVCIAVGLSGFLAARTEFIAFTGVAGLACVCAIALRDYERGAHASIALPVVCAVFLGLFHHDFHQFPEKAYQAFAITSNTFPENFKERALALWTIVLIGFALVVLLTWVERNPKREPFDAKSYEKVLQAASTAWEGNLTVGYFALIAGSSIAGLALWYGLRTHASWLAHMNPVARDVVAKLWWIAAIVPPALVFGTLFAVDLWVWAFDRAGTLGRSSFTRGLDPLRKIYAGATTAPEAERRFYAFVLAPLAFLVIPIGAFAGLYLGARVALPLAIVVALPSGVVAFLALGFLGDFVRGSRAAFLVLASVGFGLVLSGVYYPELSSQLSPKQIFQTYMLKKKEGDPLALFGVGGKTAAYYAGGQPTVIPDSASAFIWLTAKGNESRRFMAVRGDELAVMNQMYRQRFHKNLPVVDGRSSQILLLGSSLGPDEKNENPLSAFVTDSPPRFQRQIDVNLEDKLKVLGLTIMDENRKIVESVAPNKKLHLLTYYEVLAPITTDWEAFIHIDGYHRRHNGDHKPCSGKYAMTKWVVGDLIIDDYEFTLEPNFTTGDYTIFFGFWLGEGRMKVKSGPSDGDNRINGGALRIR